jgi:hypothetical protein
MKNAEERDSPNPYRGDASLTEARNWFARGHGEAAQATPSRRREQARFAAHSPVSTVYKPGPDHFLRVVPELSAVTSSPELMRRQRHPERGLTARDRRRLWLR